MSARRAKIYESLSDTRDNDNEFLAGEDVLQENVIEKSDENIISVATDSKYRTMRLKIINSVDSYTIEDLENGTVHNNNDYAYYFSIKVSHKQLSPFAYP